MTKEFDVNAYMDGTGPWEPTPPERLTFAEAAHAIRDHLTALQNAPHDEHAGPLCPICGLTTSLLRKLEDWRDA